MAETLSYVHRFEKSTEADARSLLLLHGTDGDESDLVPLGRMLRKLNVLHRTYG
jgi:phospholipase/carboxylesterase